MEAFGAAVRRLREGRGVSLRALAAVANIDPGNLSRIENGRRGSLPTRPIIKALDDKLQAGGELLAHLEGGPWILDGGLWKPADSDRLAAELLVRKPSAENAGNLAHLWLISEPPQVTAAQAGRRVGIGEVRLVEARVRQLRELDDFLGGGDTYALVTGELAATATTLATCSYTEAVGKRLLVALGELCQLAGWTLSDAGHYARAERTYLLGVSAAHAGGDRAVAANNLSSLAYQEANVGDPAKAVTLAKSAYAGARHHATPKTRALLGERIAWSAARARDAQGAERALSAVEADYVGPTAADGEPSWLYWLTPEEVEVMAGRVWTELERPLRAVPILERAIAGYGDDTGRETALYRSWMAESLALANEPEQAADAATSALRLTREAGSVRADDRVTVMRRRLRKFRGNAAVDRFMDESSPGPRGA